MADAISYPGRKTAKKSREFACQFIRAPLPLNDSWEVLAVSLRGLVERATDGSEQVAYALEGGYTLREVEIAGGSSAAFLFLACSARNLRRCSLATCMGLWTKCHV